MIKRIKNNKEFFFMFSGKVFFSLSQFLFVVIIARHGNPKDVGLFSLGVAISGPVFMFFSMQIRTLVATNTKNDFQINYYLVSILSNIILSVVVIVGYVIISSLDESTSIIIIVYLSVKSVQSYYEVLYGEYQRTNKIVYLGVSNILKGIFSVIIFYITYLLFDNLVISILSIAMSWWLVVYFYDIRKLNIKFNFRKFIDTWKHDNNIIINIIKLAIPLGIISLLYSLNTNVTRIQITNYYNETLLGYFSAVSYLMMAGNTIIGSIGQSLVSKMARSYKDINSFYRILIRLVLFGALLGGLSTLFLTLIGERLIDFIFGQAYIEYYHVFVILMATTIFKYPSEFLGYATIITKKYYLEVPLLIITLLSTFGAGIMLIPKYELIGAAISVLIGSIISSVGRSLIVFSIIHSERKKLTYD